MEQRLEQIIRQVVVELKAAQRVGSASREGDIDGIAHVGQPVGDKRLAAIVRQANRGVTNNADHVAKKHLMPFYRKVRETQPSRWESWGIGPETERELLALLQVKPRRTASGVATIAVITKPWPCGSDCLYCPNDLRMPKSYVADEPACQRAERNWFDPYLQATSRLRALTEMGHVTDKVELIILGGTWNDYPAGYRRWFVSELFRALNEASDEKTARASADARRVLYGQAGIPHTEEKCALRVQAEQCRINAGKATYNQTFPELYGDGTPWEEVAAWQQATWEEVERQHTANERASHRVVGLVVETRPDAVDARAFADMRRLGATKVQMGIQSLDARILQLNHRDIGPDRIRRAFELARLFGFKTHAHFMMNLLGASPAADKRDYLRLVGDSAIAPDEVKLYPCALVAGTGLMAHHADGSWRPYSEDELMDVLTSDLMATPAYCRMSRMIRDIPANDIVDGNKKINLRQKVEAEADRRAAMEGIAVREIRHREISVAGADVEELHLDEILYATTISYEAFLQWVTPDGRIAGFLRLSLPHADAVEAARTEAEETESKPSPTRTNMEETAKSTTPDEMPADESKRRTGSADKPESEAGVFPIAPGEAMIREVHVYGKVAGIHRTSGGAQHQGLGRTLVDRACAIARDRGYTAINVISAIGTREYYRNLGFADNGLYLQRQL